MDKKQRVIIMLLALILAITAWTLKSAKADAGQADPAQRIGADPFVVECTAYCDEGITASGKHTVEGLTIAGAREWIGCAAILYEVNENGSIGDMIGIWEFTDTGYGRDGDIPRGETVDIYLEDYDACIEWGRQEVYLQVVRGEG